MPDLPTRLRKAGGATALEAADEIERLEEELRRIPGRIEQRYANEQVKTMLKTGVCPCCGAER